LNVTRPAHLPGGSFLAVISAAVVCAIELALIADMVGLRACAGAKLGKGRRTFPLAANLRFDMFAICLR
jgi:hypothetical protein